MKNSTELQIEAKLALASRMLWEATHLAESMRDQSLADDLALIAVEVGRCLRSAMKKEGRLRTSITPSAYHAQTRMDLHA